VLKYILFGQQNETKGGWGGLRWCVDAAEQWHIGVHVWADTADGAAARHARPDEDQEEELTHGKCLVPHLLPTWPHAGIAKQPGLSNHEQPQPLINHWRTRWGINFSWS